MIKLAELRGNVYGLLSLIYSHEVTDEIIDKIREPNFLKILSELGLELDDEFRSKPKEELLLDLQVEYARLFLGPGKHILAYESAHRKNDTGSLWGEATARVKRFIEATGLEFRKGYGGIPDHISIELEFMQKLTQEESKAWKETDHDLAVRCLELEKRFMNEHLKEWIPNFCDTLMRMTQSSFYHEIAKLTKEYISSEKEQINTLLKEQIKTKNQ